MATSAESLCRYSPPAFRQYMELVINMKFDDEPKYAQLAALFADLIAASPELPIDVEKGQALVK
eukprot:4032023-Pyramimonas_sp.AAC.1